MKNGQLSELKQDGTVTVSQVTYDASEDKKNDADPPNQKPIEKQEISKGTMFLEIDELLE